MKKLFYKIEMRMGIIFENEESGELTEERFYYSNGYCIIEEGKIKGFFTDDLFQATFTQNTFFVEMIYNDYKFGEKGEFSIEKFRISFGLSNMDEEIEFPSRYIFEYKQSEADEKVLITLDLLSKVTDITKQAEIKEDLAKVGLI